MSALHLALIGALLPAWQRATPSLRWQRPRASPPRLDIDELTAEDYCLLPMDVPRHRRDDLYDAALIGVPAAVPVLAFLSYPSVMRLYHATVDLLSGKTWYAVDGGASQIAELLPVTNGIVVPSVSVAFGTLTAVTIQSLRQRQIAIRALLNKEACAVRSLYAACMAAFAAPACAAERSQITMLCRQYCTRMIYESQLGIDLEALDRLGASDSELDGIMQALFRAPMVSAEPPPSARYQSWQSNSEFTAMSLTRDLQSLRSDRLALLQTPFPSVHWFILTTLGGSVILAYLFETDVQVLQFLDELQLRYLFTLLVGSFAALASLCADLNDPFRGSFCITSSTRQLECIREHISLQCLGVEGLQREPPVGRGGDRFEVTTGAISNSSVPL